MVTCTADANGDALFEDVSDVANGNAAGPEVDAR